MPDRSGWDAQVDHTLAALMREVQGLREAQEAQGERLEARLVAVEAHLADVRQCLDRLVRRVDDLEYRVGAVERRGWAG